MSEPPIAKWDSGRPTLAQELIQAGRREQASSAAKLLATNALAGGIAGTTAVQIATWTTLKWFGLSVFFVGAGVAGWLSTRDSSDQAPTAVTDKPQGSVGASDRVAVVPATSALPTNPAPPSLSTVPAGAQSASRSKPARVRASLSRPSIELPKKEPGTQGPRDGGLREELDILQRARHAIAQGEPARALALLDARAGGFQRLPVESAIVRVEALRASGNENASLRLARELLRRYGKGPYAERLRTLAAQ